MSWTDERVELLKTMWNEGKSASVIAKELGGVTRNAVIGKVHRLGLSNRATTTSSKAAADPAPEAPTPKARPEAKPASEPEAKQAEADKERKADPAPAQRASGPARRPVMVPGQPLPPQPTGNEIDPSKLASIAEYEKSAKKLTLMQLTERTCKWPIGDPATEDFWFCGQPCQAGKPYCEQHVSIAFQPMSSRRDRRASR
ncbi:MAG: GcrA family cell cycle regulator [Rubricella sp.]